MSQATLTSSHHSRETIGRFPVFVFWIALQMIALVVVARSDIQLTANPAHRTGQWSAEILLLVQIGVSSLLFYDLLGSLRSSVLAFALAFPLTQVSAAGDGWTGLRCSVILLFWLAGLAAWRGAIPAPRLLAAAFSLWTWGSAILWYLVAEASITAPLTRIVFYSSPLLVALRGDEAFAFYFFGVFAVTGLLALGICRRATNRQEHFDVHP